VFVCWVEQKQLQPLHVQLQRVKDLTPPDFGTLVQWEKRAIGSIRAGGENNEDSVKAAHAQGLTGTPMPFLGETTVISAFSEFACICVRTTRSQ